MSRSIVITKGQHVAVYGNLKLACEKEGWQGDYDKLRSRNTPFSHNGCVVHRVPKGVSIKCFELIHMISDSRSIQKAHKQGEFYYVVIDSYNKSYQVVVRFETKHETADYHNGDRGREEVKPAGDYDVPTKIILAEEVTESGGKGINLDKWSMDQIINYINLGE